MVQFDQKKIQNKKKEDQQDSHSLLKPLQKASSSLQHNLNKVKQYRYHKMQEKIQSLKKVILGLLFTFVISFFQYQSQKPHLGDGLIQTSQEIQRVMELTLIKDKRIFKHKQSNKWLPFSYSPISSSRQIEVKTIMEYCIGFDLKNARVYFDQEKNSVQIDFGQLTVLQINVLKQEIQSEEDGWYNKWTRQERNNAFSKSLTAIKKQTIKKISQNETYIKNLAETLKHQIIGGNSLYQLRYFYPAINYTTSAIKGYLDFFKPQKLNKIKSQNKKTKKKSKGKNRKLNQKQSSQNGISKYIPDANYFKQGFQLLTGSFNSQSK